MTLLDLRRYAIRNRVRVHFTLEPAGECIINEHGVLRVPSLRSAPEFNVTASFSQVERFTLVAVDSGSRRQDLSREQLEVLLDETPQPAAPDHED